MPEGAIARRRFGPDDQRAFAELSGDFNPMHLDALTARRTAAGRPAVHGVHALLWSLDRLATSVRPGPLRAIDADFAQFLRIDEEASLVVTRSSATELRAELRADGERVAQYVLKLGETEAAGPPPAAAGFALPRDRRDPVVLSAEEVRTACGSVAYFADDAAARARFGALAEWIGADRVTSLLACTRLVGMAAPGLHSTFHRLAVSLVHGGTRRGSLVFATRPADARFAIVTMDIDADGIAGTVKASRRQPPTEQPGSAALRALVAPDAFAGHRALVVGGSRGLGEVAAKLLAAGGAEVSLTWANGAADAEAVVADIRQAGGRAGAFRYDCLAEAGPQLAAVPQDVGSVYYFATTQIFGRTAPGFSSERFAAFSRVYVAGFDALVAALLARRPGSLVAFYPSSVAVDDTPRNMGEYAMAKAAGEVLCRHITRFSGRAVVDIERLPRLPTDQTASMIEQEAASPATVIGAIVHRVEGLVHASSS